MKDKKDAAIQGKFKKALNDALRVQQKSPEEAAALLQVEIGTMYKYLAGDMIPGGQVLWRACLYLGLVLDRKGVRAGRSRVRHLALDVEQSAQYELPFINESLSGDKLQAHVRRKDNQYVQVSLRIKVAG